MTGEEVAEVMRVAFARQAQVKADWERSQAELKVELDAEMRGEVRRGGWVRVLGADELYRHVDHAGDFDLEDAYDLAWAAHRRSLVRNGGAR